MKTEPTLIKVGGSESVFLFPFRGSNRERELSRGIDLLLPDFNLRLRFRLRRPMAEAHQEASSTPLLVILSHDLQRPHRHGSSSFRLDLQAHAWSIGSLEAQRCCFSLCSTEKFHFFASSLWRERLSFFLW